MCCQAIDIIGGIGLGAPGLTGTSDIHRTACITQKITPEIPQKQRKATEPIRTAEMRKLKPHKSTTELFTMISILAGEKYSNIGFGLRILLPTAFPFGGFLLCRSCFLGLCFSFGLHNCWIRQRRSRHCRIDVSFWVKGYAALGEEDGSWFVVIVGKTVIISCSGMLARP